MTPSNLGCAFTGHRTLPKEEIPKIRELLSRSIAYAYENGCRSFYNGGAIGFDIEAAECVLTFRLTHPDVRLVMLLPCKGQDAKWSLLQKNRYHNVLRSADEVIYINEFYTPSCMRERNEALVANADMLIAYLSHMNSGAAQTVAMAKRKGIPTFNIYNKK